MRKYGVIIVTYNRINLLKECLDKVFSQSYPVSHIIIVDNASDDKTVEYLKSLSNEAKVIKVFEDKDGLCVKRNNTKLTLVFNKENKGGAGGFADGVAVAAEDMELDYVTLIDDDAMLSRDYIENIDHAIEKNIKENNQIKAYSGVVRVDDTIDTSHRRRVKSKGLARFCEVSEKEYESEYFEYDLTSFCGLTIECELMRKIGLPKAEYFIRYDDTEYSLRIRKYSKIFNINKSVINHKTKLMGLDVKASSEADFFKLYHDVRNRIDMARCHLGIMSVVILYTRAIIQIILNSIMSIVTLFHNKENRCYHKNMVKCYKNAVKDAKKLKQSKIKE